MVWRVLDEAFDVTTWQYGQDEVGLRPVVRPAEVLPEVVDRNDVRVISEAPHGLRLTGDALPACLVEALRLDQGEGNLAVEQGVVGEVDLLLAALTEEAPDLVPTIGEEVG